MKGTIALLSMLLLAGVGVFTATQLQTEEMTISASYQMLACEKCNHMTVEKSENPLLVGETIIPVSDTIDVEEMIDGIALTKGQVCLKGRLYKFNFNLLNFSPDGKRFEITSLEDQAACSKL